MAVAADDAGWRLAVAARRARAEEQSMQTGKFWLLALCCAASVAQAAPLLKLSALPTKAPANNNAAMRRWCTTSAPSSSKVQFVTLPDYSSVAEGAGARQV